MAGFLSRESKESARMPVPRAPEPVSDEKEELAPPAPRKELKPQPQIEMPEGTPPLFIKIDKYGDIIKNMQRLKSFSLGLRDALDALSDIEKELNTGLTIANRALDNFNTTINMMDTKLLRIAGTTETDKETGVPDELDDYIKNVYEQMTKLKHELKTIQ
jgi:uncharacterized phage infection (PIP) family protein YhgE